MNKLLVSCMIVVFLAVFSPTATLAHKMIIEPIGEGAIQVIYEDGSFSTRTKVTVYNQEGDSIDSGYLDSYGYFYYDKAQAHLLIADDGIGHRSEWQIGKEIAIKTAPYRWITALIVILTSCAIACYYSFKIRNAKT